ncbi:DNA methyltransferase [Nonomuraea turcica]|uniref:DNA methyltransferase n=1 Tax=Nonomuraea sp. G32 TaxID=3067274 RepID=UPI00273CED32|nr:DNA methyltransferase [Nonomuraea sp. G32]MDP4503711.1 hypothetical protein [Nonomuraea sp. G32]
MTRKNARSEINSGRAFFIECDESAIDLGFSGLRRHQIDHVRVGGERRDRVPLPLPERLQKIGERLLPHLLKILPELGPPLLRDVRVPAPADLLRYRGWEGKQTENRWSHWVWRQYASAFWDDIRLDRVLPYRQARDEEDEKHVHPLQLDVIDRCLALWSNPAERVFTPFAGVGSELYSAVRAGRYAVGVELKPSYYRQALKNLAAAEQERDDEMPTLGGGEISSGMGPVLIVQVVDQVETNKPLHAGRAKAVKSPARAPARPAIRRSNDYTASTTRALDIPRTYRGLLYLAA